MPVAYVVRCNFLRPDLEDKWNDWYSGPKLAQMLAKPMFLTGQRFRREKGEGRDYLAFWTLEAPAAFDTPEYRNDWGFFEWKPHITDWSRDLFEPNGAQLVAPIVQENQRLHVIAFDGATDTVAVDADARALSGVRPNLVWMRISGLDRHTPLLGFEVILANTELLPLPAGALERVQTFYRPISDFRERSAATA